MANDFIAWDSRLTGLIENLRELRETRSADVLGLPEDPKVGVLWGQQLQPRLDAAARILTILQDPNANAGFELGYVMGKGKPWAIATPASSRPAWLSRPPLRGVFVQEEAEHIDKLEALLEAAWPPGLRASMPGTGAVILHCDCNLAEVLKRRTSRAFPELRLLTPPADPVGLSQALTGVGEVVWIIPRAESMTCATARPSPAPRSSPDTRSRRSGGSACSSTGAARISSTFSTSPSPSRARTS